jgi:hypothetical protein
MCAKPSSLTWIGISSRSEGKSGSAASAASLPRSNHTVAISSKTEKYPQLFPHVRNDVYRRGFRELDTPRTPIETLDVV